MLRAGGDLDNEKSREEQNRLICIVELMRVSRMERKTNVPYTT